MLSPWGGTEGSNPSPSSGESAANLTFGLSQPYVVFPACRREDCCPPAGGKTVARLPPGAAIRCRRASGAHREPLAPCQLWEAGSVVQIRLTGKLDIRRDRRKRCIRRISIPGRDAGCRCPDAKTSMRRGSGSYVEGRCSSRDIRRPVLRHNIGLLPPRAGGCGYRSGISHKTAFPFAHLAHRAGNRNVGETIRANSI
jgi:hypothetical protein